MSNFISLQRKVTELKKNQKDIEDEINKHFKKNGELRKKYAETLTDEQKEHLLQQKELLKYSDQLLSQYKEQLTVGSLIRSTFGTIENTMDNLTGINIRNELSFMKIGRYLVESDKVIKDLNLKLGLSGKRAEIMSDNFKSMTSQITVLGGRLSDLIDLQSEYADITGRVRLLSESAQKSVIEIGKGTGLGVKKGSQLAAQFENIGVDALKANKLVENIVDQSERMGLNTQKILDNVIDSFKQSQRFYFKRGVAALAQMS
ncbi:MAG: hypothetical protein AABY22_03595, partial [Nanoarchaeota archaeon]